jgi:hypothetical protein
MIRYWQSFNANPVVTHLRIYFSGFTNKEEVVYNASKSNQFCIGGPVQIKPFRGFLLTFLFSR